MRRLLTALMIVFTVAPALAHDGIHIENAYARVAMENAPTAAVFMELVNHGTAEDRLIAVQADIADMAELHTHMMSADGMMQMLPVPDGFAIAPGMTHALARGGDHIMLMGLSGPMVAGTKFTLTLTFEVAGKVVVVVPVRNEDPAGVSDHSAHGAAPVSE